MEQTGQSAPPPSIQPESSTVWPRLLPWIATGSVVLLYIVVKILTFLNPEWLNMRVEWHYTMQPPGGIRNAPNSSLLETFSRTSDRMAWSAYSPVCRTVAALSMVCKPRQRRFCSCTDGFLLA